MYIHTVAPSVLTLLNGFYELFFFDFHSAHLICISLLSIY